MTRDEAKQQVDQFTQQHGQYSYVNYGDAKAILGDDRFERLLKDKVRWQGPLPATVYPWNVIDYLANPGLNSNKA